MIYRSKIGFVIFAVLYFGTIFLSFQIQQTRFSQAAEFLTERKPTEIVFQIRSEPTNYLARFASDQEQTQYSFAAKLISARIQDNWYEISVPITLNLSAEAFPYSRGQTISAPVKSVLTISGKRSCCLVRITEEIKLINPANVAFRFAHKARSNLQHTMPDTFELGAALVPGLVLGDTTGQSDELTGAMRGSGLSHLTAVSGGNVAIVLGFFLAVFLLFGFCTRSLIIIAAIVLASYVLIVGFDASVLRASIMGSITLLAVLTQRAISTAWTLVLAVYLLTVFNPWLWLNWGFLLSVTATAALVWFSPKIIQLISWPKPYDIMTALLAATFAASWATAPVLAVLTGEISTVTLLANFLAAPLVAITTILGLVTVLIALVNPVLAMPSGFIAAVPAEMIGIIALRTASFPGAQLEVDRGLNLLLFVALVMGLVLSILLLKNRKAILFSTLSLILSYPLLLGTTRIFDGWPPTNYFLIACDVGQGTAVVLPISSSSAVLIDTGPDGKEVGRCLAEAGIDEVPLLFISHFHADHAGGVISILNTKQVSRILTSPNLNPISTSAAINNRANQLNIPMNRVEAGASIGVGEYQIEVLSPSSTQTSNENDASLILRVTSGSQSFLFTGDIEPLGQQRLMKQSSPNVDLALVPHHGSKFQDPKFANWTGAELGIISVGENRFGHPSLETIANWQQSAKLARTDEAGDLAVVRNESGWQVFGR